MNRFKPGPFSDISNTTRGKDMWAFLRNHDSRIGLETATYLKRPALAALQEQLLDEFGDDIRKNRWKQLMGFMVRQIMEDRQYVLERTGVKVRVGNLFTTAARYKKL